MKILIADDHALYRKGMRELLLQLDDGVADILEAGDWHTTLTLMTQHQDCALALIDLHMPGMDGFDGLQALLDRAETVPIVVVTASESPLDMKRALDRGAMGYIAKSETTTVTLCALRLVLSGGVYVPPKMIRSPSNAGAAAKLPFGLTARQYHVLEHLAQGKSNKQIAKELQMSDRTVKAHVGAIFKALGVSSRQEAIKAVGQREVN